MTFSLGIVGTGQFAQLFHHHPGVGDLRVTDVRPERAEALAGRLGATTTASLAELLE